MKKIKPLRILIINYEFPPLGGGGGVAAKKLALGFIEQGYKVDYVTTRFADWPKYEVIDGINIYRTKVIGRKKLETATLISLITFPILALPTALKLCLQNRYAFINSHFAVPSGVLGVVIAKIFGIKHILTIIGGDIFNPTNPLSPHKKWYFRKIVQYVLNNVHTIVAISENTKENAIKRYKPKKDISVIPLPYTSYKFKPISRNALGMENNKTYLISIGRLIKRKGFDYLLEALSLIERADIELLIVGEGYELENLKTLASHLNTRHKITFLGSVSEEKKFQYLSQADIYVLSSVHEGFGIVLQEAMQVGLPIIATNNGGQCDLIENGVNGLLVRSESAKEIANAVENLLDNQNLINRMEKENKRKIKSFLLENIVSRYCEVVSNGNNET